MAAKSILIGGGSGFIGQGLNKLLKSSGYKVTIISRMPGLNRITWHDLDKSGLPENTFAVINLAGQNVLDPTRRWTPGFKQNCYNSRINTTKACANAIQQSNNKPEVFISISGIALYKPDPNKIYTETSSTSEYDFMSKLCIHWEAAAELPTDISTRLVRIRSGVVLGREGGMIKSLYTPFWFGLGGKIASGQQPLPWIHIVDMCNLIKFCIETNKINRTVVNGVAPDIITNDQFTKAFASAMYRPAMIPMQEFIVDLIFGKERGVMLKDGQKIHPENALKYGFNFKYPKIADACYELAQKR